MTPSAASLELTNKILEFSHECIGKQILKELKSTHPWMIEQVVEAKVRKRKAEGTEREKEETEKCSQIILQARIAYTEKTITELEELKRGPGNWCEKSAELSEPRGGFAALH